MNKSKAHKTARANKERFKERRRKLLLGAKEVTSFGAQVFIVVHRSDTFYCYNSEESQGWLPWDVSDVSHCSLLHPIATKLRSR